MVDTNKQCLLSGMPQRPFGSVVLGTGSFLPAGFVANDALAAMFSVSEEWISSRTGIQERSRASDGESTSVLAYQASKQALEASGCQPEQIGLIIVATVTPDYPFPGVACQLQVALGCVNAFGFDMSVACNGFIAALQVADQFLKTGLHKYALVVGADTMSRITDYSDRNTAILFADGAGAVVLGHNEHDASQGLLGSVMYMDGRYVNDLYVPYGGSVCPNIPPHIRMNGRAVFQSAVRSMTAAVHAVLENTSYALADVTCIIPHQANQRIMDAVAENLNFPKERVLSYVKKMGNTCAATVPYVLDQALRNLELKSGDLVILTSVGAGFTWGAVLLRV